MPSYWCAHKNQRQSSFEKVLKTDDRVRTGIDWKQCHTKEKKEGKHYANIYVNKVDKEMYYVGGGIETA